MYEIWDPVVSMVFRENTRVLMSYVHWDWVEVVKLGDGFLEWLNID